jgi:hypothetical protein
MAVTIAAIAGFAFTIGLIRLINRPLEQQEQDTQQPTIAPSENSQDCFATVGSESGGNVNIRSTPTDFFGTKYNLIREANYGEMLPATGKKTPKGWVQVKLPDGRLGWVGPAAITNKEEIVSCLQSKGVLHESEPDIPRPPSPSPSPINVLGLEQVIPSYKQSVTAPAFITCPENTSFYLLGETEKHYFAVCGENGEPRYYIGKDKKIDPPLTVPWSADGFIKGKLLFEPPFYGITHSSNDKIRVYTNKDLAKYKEYEVIRLYKYPNIPAPDNPSPLESPSIDLGGE